MRLFEISGPRLFLCTTTKQAIGGIVSADGEGPLGAEMEDLLEAERPDTSLSRRGSIFLATCPGGAEFTYLVEVQERLERQHAGWLKMLADADPMQDGVRRHCAIGYWSGKECGDERREPWLYRAEAVRVVSRIGRSSRDI